VQGEKNEHASAFYCTDPVFDLKRILAQAIAHQKDHAQPEGEKIAQPPPQNLS